jgi:tRNA-modifying protein YgfZ
MSAGQIAYLEDRAAVRVSGPDAGPFLQGLITNDMGLLETQPSIFAGLLSPQGKVLFEFLIAKAGDGFLLAVARPVAADLIKRLTMYKLRAKVEIAQVADILPPRGTADPRFACLENDSVHYDARRISLGVPDGGKDYAFGDLFPHEAMLDQLNGVSFTKGCYVGQEIVSRMQHRGTARSRFLIVDADAALPPMGTAVLANDKPLGRMGSNAGKQGLALIRLDRLADVYAAKMPITTAGIMIRLTKPAYATFEVPTP